MPTELTIEKAALLVGLSFFLGLAFEGFYRRSASSRPGGIRTFPLLALTGGFLYLIDPQHLIPYACGLLVLGIWLYPYYRAEVRLSDAAREPADGIMVPVCNLLVFVLGPVVLTQPAWAAIGLTVLAVLLLRAREQLHRLATRIPGQEIITLGQFLILTGIILPLVPREPVASFTTLTPFQVWTAVVAVCTISYVSYLLQRYVSPTGSVLVASLLGGLYSSTATTVVLARRMRRSEPALDRLRAGIVLATAVMYLRIALVVAIFNVPLALALAPPLAVLAAIGALLAFARIKRHDRETDDRRGEDITPRNPLEIGTALLFAAVFVVVAVATAWLKRRLGAIGVYALAAVVGVTDIDPFVLSLAHTSTESGLSLNELRVAVLIAASSNNVLKALYTVSLGGWHAGRRPSVELLLLAAIGLLIAGTLAAGLLSIM